MASLPVLAFLVLLLSTELTTAAKNEVKVSPVPGPVPVSERVHGQFNLFRQPLEFALDIAIGFDIAKFGSGQLSQLPILTLLVGVAGFFLVAGVVGTPFMYLIDKKKRRFRRGADVDGGENCFGAGGGNALCSSDDDGRTGESSFVSRWRGFDVDDGFEYLGLPLRNDTSTDFSAEEDMSCRKYLLCEVHRYFHLLPRWAHKVIALFGKRLKNIGPYKEAINAGLELEDCWSSFHQCPRSMLQIVSSLPIKIQRKR